MIKTIDMGDGWVEHSKVVCEDHRRVLEDVAHYCKNSIYYGWKDRTEEQIIDILKDHGMGKFLDEVKEGDKVEAWSAYGGPLAASGGLRIVRGDCIIKTFSSWVS